MLPTILLLLGSAGVIYLACESFVNGVEWVGRRLGVSQTATGTILAAFGTALPESVVTLMATAFGTHPGDRQIGIGAALGGPLVLGTAAYAVVGLALLATGRGNRPARGAPILADGRRLSRDQAWFLGVFVCKIALGLVAFAGKPVLGLAFLAAYGAYVWVELRDGEDGADDDCEPLKIRPGAAAPHVGWALIQTFLALTVTFVASRLFVGQLERVGPWLRLSPAVTALLLSPVATELPEMVNALIWVRLGKARLALANISGSMMIQATVPTAFGLFFTPWLLGKDLLIAAGVTAFAVALLFLMFRSGRARAVTLAQVGWLYPAFGALLWFAR
jgi:cation:H+ antiporter